MAISDERRVATTVRLWAERQHMPPYAPVAMAEQVAVTAYREGASPAGACARGEAYLSSWLRHPSNSVRRHRRLALVS